MRVKKNRVPIGMVLVSGLLFSILEFILDSESGLWLTMVMLAINICIGISKSEERMTYLIFNFTFFTFLVGKLFFNAVDGEDILSSYSTSTIDASFLYLTISLACITIGMFFCEAKKKKKTGEIEYGNNKGTGIDELLIQIIKIAFYISYPFYLITIIEKAIFVNNTSYLDYYTTYSSLIPYFLVKVGELNQILFAFLFCTECRKRKLIIPLVLFALTSVLSLGIGQRNIFVLNVIMMAVCLAYANRRSIAINGERLYSKKFVWGIAVLIPVAISFLYAWGNYRQGTEESVGFAEGIKEFFISQGGQIEFFADTIEYKGQIWAQKVPYTFSSIYNYFRNLFGMINYGTYTRKNALEGNSLGATQFYITSPGSLLSGKGAGCCYLSELYFDAGIIGIIIGSLFLGYILRYLKLDEKRKPWMNAFAALMIRWIVYIPRASYFDWLSNAFNIWNVTMVILILAVVDLVKKRK